MSSAISPLKAALRASHRQRRTGCDPFDPGFAQHLRALLAWQDAAVIAGYLGYGSEPRVTHLLQEAIAAGRTVLIPRLMPDEDLGWAPWDGDLDHLVRRGNLLEPAEPGSLEAIAYADLVITPALAVDRRGHRLGQGGGSFDRALARASHATVVALIYDHDLVDELPTEEHDRQIDIAITPSKAVRFRD